MSANSNPWETWDADYEGFDAAESSTPPPHSLYSRLSDSNALYSYLTRNTENKRDSELSWSDYFDAAWTGTAHGFTTHGPEQLYRAARTLARLGGTVFDTSGIEAWATEGINAQLRERELDPWYRPDERWLESEWGRSLYHGFSNVASSMMSGLPAGIAAAAAPFTGGVSLGALLFTGSAYLAEKGASAVVAGLSTYDQFLDEAYAAAREADPNITFETLASDKFWSALVTGLSESGTGFVSGLIGGKLAGIIGKPAGKHVLGVALRTVRNVTNNMAAELGSEAANAAFQDWVREINGMSSEGRIQAMLNIVGPTLVSGALGGIKQTLGEPRTLSPAELEAQLRQTDGVRRRSLLSPEGIDIMERLSVDSQDHGQTAFETALVLDAQARRVAGESDRNAADFLRSIDVNSPELRDMVQALRNPDASLQDVVRQSLNQVSKSLDADSRKSILDFFTHPKKGFNEGGFLQSFQEFVNNPEATARKWKMTDEVRNGFSKMTDLFSDSVNALASDSSVKVNSAAQEFLNTRQGYEAPKNAGMRFNRQALEPVLSRWEGKDLSNPENRKAFLAEALPHMDLDLSNSSGEADASAIFRDAYLAYKPLLEQMQKSAEKKSDATTVENAKGVIDGKPGFELFADTFKAVDGVDDKQAAINMVLKISEEHVKILANMIVDSDGVNTGLEFQAQSLLLNHKIMKDSDKAIGREVARALRMRRFSKNDPQFMEKAQSLMNADRKPDARRILWEALANSDDEKLLKHNLNIPLGARTVDAVMEYVTSNMLWGPSTHLVNFMGNTIQMFNKVVERGFATHLMPEAADGVRSGETIGMIQGFWKGLRDIREMWRDHRNDSKGFMDALLTSENMWDGTEGTMAADAGMMNRAISSERFGLSREHGAVSGGLATVVDLLGSFTNVPFALLNHSDQIFKHVYAQGELNALLIRHARGDKQRLAELSANPPRDLMNKAREAAKVLMFQGDLDKVSKGLDQMRNAAPILRYFLPFLKTPINIFKEGVSLTPFISRVFGNTREQLNSPNTATRQLAEAHVMLGTLLWTSALTAASQGLLTGPGPEDHRKRRKKEAAGWMGNSLHLGDYFINLERMDPVALIFNAAAFIVEASDHIDKEDFQRGMLMGVGQTMRIISDRTYLSSMRDALEFFTMPEKGIPNFLRRVGGSVVPAGSMGRQLNRSIDPFQREAMDFWSGMAQSVPGMSQFLPERRDFLGQKMEAHEYLGPGFLSPFRVSSNKSDPVYNEVARLEGSGHSAAPMPGRDIRRGEQSLRMTPHEYASFLEMYGNGTRVDGKTAKQTLQSLVGSAEYQRLPDSQRAKLIRAALLRFGKQAKEEFVKGSPRLKNRLGSKADGWENVLENIYR